MDNKLTKRRLSDFLAYEWILTLIVVAAAIIVLELVYTVSAARLTTGQVFKYYFDQDLYTYEESGNSLYGLLDWKKNENGKTFSYDVLSVESENLVSSYNVLSVRLSVQEGDALFTSSVEAEDGSSRIKSVIDANPVYSLEKLLADAKDYLKKFLKDGETDIYAAENYDESKISDCFDTRMKGDNRFRTEEQKAEGRLKEIGRIKKLAAEVKDFEKIMTIGESKGLFFKYTKYAYAAENDTSRDQNNVKARDKEIAEGRENAVYGLNLSALTYEAGKDKKDVSAFFKIQGKDDAEGVVMVLFDFLSYQSDLQFESVCFVNTIVREFSDFLD